MIFMKKTIIAISLFFSINAMAEMVKIIPKGTVLTCPKDNKPVMMVKKDLTLYGEIAPTDFKFTEDYPSDVEQTVPCEVIKELCFHVDNKWIGFSKDCGVIPKNAGKYTFKEFISEKRKEKSERESLVNQKFECTSYKEDKEVSICISKDKKWKCIKSNVYPGPTHIGPCVENK